MSNKEPITYARAAEHLQKISDSLDEITKELIEVNDKIKTLEKNKESLRSRFFNLIDEHIRICGANENEVLFVKCASRAEAEQYVFDNHPGWLIVQYDPEKIVIEEDPSKMKFYWTTPDGYQIGRTTAVVGTRFDFDYLEKNAPDLFNEVVESKTVYELNEKKAQKLLDEHPEYLPVLQDATKLGKIQLRLSSPKKVEEE